MKQIIISGASGFIGHALAQAYIAQGAEVYGLCIHPDRLGGIRFHPKFHTVQAGFQEYRLLPERLPERSFDAFIHCAWQGVDTGRNDCSIQLPNIIGACEAAYAAAGCGCRRFLLARTFHEFMKTSGPDGALDACSLYGAAKTSASHMCQAIAAHQNMEYIGLILSNIFGVGERSAKSTSALLRQLMSNQDLDLIMGDNLYDWTYIDDCIGGIVAAAQLGKAGRSYYIGNRRPRTFREIITEIRDIVSPCARLRFGTYPDNSWVDYTQIDTDALYRDTGYLPVCDFRESILKTVEWFHLLDSELELKKD